MSILIDKSTKVVVQGITGRDGSFHAKAMKAYGTHVVAGVTPGKGGQSLDGIPVFETVREAVEQTGANASGIFVPPGFAPDAVREAIDAGIKLVVVVTEGVPALEMCAVHEEVRAKGARVVGPNSPGLISPGKCKLGIMPAEIHRPGPVGVVSRSGTLTYEMVDQLTKSGLGQTTCLGIGGDPVIGTTFMDALMMFKDDPETKGVVLLGEIGGTAEEEAAVYIKEKLGKPVVAFIAGQTAPPGRRMGHAGAIISGGSGTAAEKIKALETAGIRVARLPSEIGPLMKKALRI
ncbi:MAG: succinate--CoA ligase subunit alpha [Candidatus Eisenbacteria bacterium]|uniref:Succinate--CoA ligase [ADP-forming] subunit alpha n=1 Tax=Eiseniibacteriota bacterium TaxID=2212470 RepID=A0A948RV73_UNCEI|nr:succinate--CoA ligase subunit alpha [Candidatus Eisenbacteria bacterium]MBU1948928.1 succinate--CoA ligase subunit alpha [Candidatus Eisenbacteria bacterium]MBU2690586.1 succinate--CoA ligase subunit alpha [Candidatus Eisenbacteria bacterium]